MTDLENWYCPDCVTNNLVPEAVFEAEETPEIAAGRISRDRIASDLLPPQRGALKPGSHSVFNELITPDDPMDGSRLLRKRKTSPTETDDSSSQKRKTRDKDHNTSQTNMAHVDAPVETPHEEMEIDVHVDATGLSLTNGELKKADTPSHSRASRTLRIKSNAVVQAPVTITEKSKTSIKITFRVNPASLKKILSQPPKPSRKGRKDQRKIVIAPPSQAISYTPSFGQPFYSLHGKETDESKSKPYGGILTTEEADTTLTLPKTDSRRQFDEGRQKAEDEWKSRVALAAEAAAALGHKKSKKVSGPASQIEYIEFGQHQIDTWYAAPYPEEYSRNKAVFICEFCLKYMESDIVAWRHKTKCPWKNPPGDEIYRDGKIMMFEVDGRKNQFYCQNLCLLAKLFLGSKTLYYDVEPFLFYVMTEYDEYGCHFVGYFSKEKRPSSQNNVSCILVLPIHQRKGYGHLLMDFSYLLTRVEKKTGSPEKPLSDMGLVSYRNYWRLILSYYLRGYRPGDPIPSIRKMSIETGMTPDDVISALDALGSLIREPDSGTYAFKLKTDIYNTVIEHHEVKKYPALNSRALIWTPYIVGRGGLSIYEHAPPLNTVAPREDDEVQSVELSHSNTNGSTDHNHSFETKGVTDTMLESFSKMSNGSDTFYSNTQIKGKTDGASSSSKVNSASKPLSYFEAAASIPATQFLVFPPPKGSSRARGTPRPLLSRTTPSSRASAGRLRATPRANHSVRRSSARPKSTTRKKSGGTGRGPGRWPKGTKKSDFQNAESGPGLPPKMIKQRSRLYNEVLLGDEDEENGDENDIAVEMEEDDDEDGIVYETPAPSRRRDRNRNLGKAVSVSGGSRRSAVKGMDNDFVITGDIDEGDEMEDGPVLADMDVDR